jgi:hypothetical protein
MSAEFPAKQARNITNNKDDWNCELWYGKYKDYLFQQIQAACLQGHDHLLINIEQWQSNEVLKQHLIQRLTSLGYAVKLRDGWKNEEEMIVSW